MPATPVANVLSLADQVAAELREDLIGGRLLPGMALVEAELVKRYNASRNTVREALHQLGREGLASYVRNKGVMVRRLGAAEVRDLFLVRRQLEIQAILASRRLHAEQLAAMHDALEAAQLAREREDWRAAATHGLRFHQHIVGLQHSPLLDGFFTIIAAQMRLVFALAPDEAQFQRPWLQRDQAMLQALANGERSHAADLMQHYLDDSERSLLERLPATHP